MNIFPERSCNRAFRDCIKDFPDRFKMQLFHPLAGYIALNTIILF